MSQGYGIELYFDPAMENQPLKTRSLEPGTYWLTAKSVLILSKSNPDLTLPLFSCPLIDPLKLENIVKTMSYNAAVPISFTSIGTIPDDRNVLFFALTPSMALLQFHSQLCDALKKEGFEIGEDYRPGSWIPYCLVAEQVPKAQMAEAFTVLRDVKLPYYGYAMDVGLVEFSPVRKLYSTMLGTKDEE
ncbi:RNA ligase/cyclic nucleotide phosphodiesterase family protein [Actinidia rufa]|uniref:RNA ligase/cyclic nucleotide phosphodiesterase family protein n=1 Tax=Actinidia rufa TaxID=165716 RepID=A0A7J0FBE7_9ERIC|nr:RNA ligase/cyclic nucleotide phosphodiesterase family protein [Actinidia rufa]